MLQGDLDLAGGVLGNRRACRNPLGLAGDVKVAEERLDLLQFAQAVDLGLSRTATVGIQRRLRAPLRVALLVEQVELQLAGHHRVIAVGFELLDHPHQQLARVGGGCRQAFAGVHGNLYRSSGNLPPGQAHQATGQRVGAAVDIAYVPDQAGVLDILAEDGQAQHGARQRPATLIQRQQFLAMQQLAARHAVGVEDEQLDQFDVGVVGQESLGFLHSSESRHIALACASQALGVRTARSILEQVAQADNWASAAAGMAQPSEFSGWGRRPVGARGGSATAPRRRG